ncbi:disulfide bond formation protein B [Mesobacterium pallidum]|uniref:disulfide bond formation protein B n=1 Tax=Mesobacterium pallidum TaxID=2872037 RepID=UPI001EE18F1D
MNSFRLILLATLGSTLLILGALAFQFIGEMPPCKLCYWQRYPHVAAIAIGALALGQRGLAWLGAAAAATTAGIGIYHSGVEQGWWEGPTTCTSGPIGGLSTDDLLNQIMAAPLVRCDEIPWEMFGLSMAGWNALISLGLTAIWIMAARRA